MELISTRSFLMKINTQNIYILNIWNSLLEILKLAPIEFCNFCPKSLKEGMLLSYKISIIIQGDKDILINISGLLENIKSISSLVKNDLLVILSEMFPSYLQKSNNLIKHRILIRNELNDSISFIEK